MERQTTVTALLARASAEDPQWLLDQLFPLVYDELREMAHRQLYREHDSRTLSTTALVHECYLRLVDQVRVPVKSRRYFFGAAARAMRQVLVDTARRRRSLKRGEGRSPVPLDEELVATDAFAAEVLDLDAALARLADSHPRVVQVVECRFFAGLSLAETTEALAISESTVRRDWILARAWLGRELGGPTATPAEG